MADSIAISKLRLFIADDHVLLREGMKMLLAAQMDFEVVGEASSGDETLQGLLTTAPDVAVLDLGLPGRDGFTVAAMAKKALPRLRVVMVTGSFDAADREHARAMGISGYVLKSEPPDVLIAAIRGASGGKELAVCSSGQAGVVEREPLTERERQVLARIVRGKSNGAIAEELHISVLTVRTHRQNIMRKAGASNAAQLAAYAIRMNCTEY